MVMAKTAQLDKTQATTLIKTFLDQFQKVMSKPTPPAMADLDKFLSSNFNITHNGRTIARSLSEYMKRAEALNKKYSKFQIDIKVNEPLATSNKMVINYDLQLTSRSNQKLQVHIMALATIEDNKISNWVEITNIEGSPRWDA